MNQSTVYDLDSKRNVSKVTDALGKSEIYGRDGAGNVASIEDREGRVTQRMFDSKNRLVRVEDALQGETFFAYSPLGQLTTVTDAKNQAREYAYNTQDQLSGIKNALNQTQSFQYDQDGNLTETIKQSGARITYAYDAAGRLTQKTTPSRTESYLYDADGLLTSVSDGTVSVLRDYNEHGRLLKERQSFLSNADLDYRYDDQGRKNRVRLIIGNQVLFEQSFAHAFGDFRVSQMSVGSLTLNYSRNVDPLHRTTFEFLPNSVFSSRIYDELSQVKRLQNFSKNGQSALSEFVYTYSPVGNITSISEVLEGSGAFAPQANVNAYSYDALDRLTNSSGFYDESFNYDAVGNFTSFNQVHNAINQLVEDGTHTYAYDLNGNLLSRKRKDNSKESLFYWDSENRLTGVEYKIQGSTVKTIAYQYDGLNRRVQKVLTDLQDSLKSHTRRYVYDGWNVIAELNGSNELIAIYMHGLEVDHPIAMLRDLNQDGRFSSNEVYTYTRDHLGSIKELVNHQGKVVQRYRYSAYGKTVLEKANPNTDHETVENIYAYTGREYDSDTELYGYRNRYYMPEIGRFISEDPIGMASGDLNYYNYVDSVGKLHPTDSNLYAYARNNPLRYNDPLGLLFEDVLAQHFTPAKQLFIGTVAAAVGAYFIDAAVFGSATGVPALASAALGAFLVHEGGLNAVRGGERVLNKLEKTLEFSAVQSTDVSSRSSLMQPSRNACGV